MHDMFFDSQYRSEHIDTFMMDYDATRCGSYIRAILSGRLGTFDEACSEV